MELCGWGLLLEWGTWLLAAFLFFGSMLWILPAFGLGVWIYSRFRKGKSMYWQRIRWLLAGTLLAAFIYTLINVAWCFPRAVESTLPG